MPDFRSYFDSDWVKDKLFLGRINRTGDCWIWTGSKTVKGYGKLGRNGKTIAAHVYMLEQLGIDRNGLHVLHKCDNPPCVNPSHLFLGTHADNMRDKLRKGRSNNPIGERVGLAKMTARHVVAIRYLVTMGHPRKDVANMYNIGKTTLWKILNKETWRHV